MNNYICLGIIKAVSITEKEKNELFDDLQEAEEDVTDIDEEDEEDEDPDKDTENYESITENYTKTSEFILNQKQIIYDRKKNIYDFMINNREDINMFSLINYYNISIENNDALESNGSNKIDDFKPHNIFMRLTPKCEDNYIRKFVTMEPLDSRHLYFLYNYKNIKVHSSYDFLSMLIKEPNSSSIFTSHYSVLIVRKRNKKIQISILDPLDKDHYTSISGKLKEAFVKFFKSYDDDDEVEYLDQQCGQQFELEASNCGEYSFKFIYNYLLLSHDNDDNKVIKAICPGGDKKSRIEKIPIYLPVIYKGPANNILKDELQYFYNDSVDNFSLPKEFRYITLKEKNFILKFNDEYKKI